MDSGERIITIESGNLAAIVQSAAEQTVERATTRRERYALRRKSGPYSVLLTAQCFGEAGQRKIAAFSLSTTIESASLQELRVKWRNMGPYEFFENFGGASRLDSYFSIPSGSCLSFSIQRTLPLVYRDYLSYALSKEDQTLAEVKNLDEVIHNTLGQFFPTLDVFKTLPLQQNTEKCIIRNGSANEIPFIARSLVLMTELIPYKMFKSFLVSTRSEHSFAMIQKTEREMIYESNLNYDILREIDEKRKFGGKFYGLTVTNLELAVFQQFLNDRLKVDLKNGTWNCQWSVAK